LNEDGTGFINQSSGSYLLDWSESTGSVVLDFTRNNGGGAESRHTQFSKMLMGSPAKKK